MKAAFNYLFFGILLIPLLPVLYWQGRRVRQKVPRLSEAEEPAGTAESSSKHTERTINVLLLGESTFAGIGVNRHTDGIAGATASAIASELDATVNWQVLARSGYTVREVRKKLLPQYIAPIPDIVIIGVGGNDAFGLNNPVAWRLSVRKLITELREKFPDVPILFAAVPPIREFPAFPSLMQRIIGGLVEMLGRELQLEVLRHPNVYLQQPNVIVKDWLEDSESSISVDDFFSDGVHPAPSAYRLWGESLGKFIADHQILKL